MDSTRSHPEPYFFLLTAGVIDVHDGPTRETKQCSRSLARLAALNGTYKDLDDTFRASMREALGCPSDTHVKRVLHDVALACAAPDKIPEGSRAQIRTHLSNLSKFWPEHPEEILPSMT